MEVNLSVLEITDLYDEALKVIQNPLYDPESPSFEAVVQVLRNCELLQKILSSPPRLEEFLQLAKFHLNYEVYDSAKVLVQEKDGIDRLYFVLKGSVQKLQQKVFHELEKEMKEERVQNSLRAQRVLRKSSRGFEQLATLNRLRKISLRDSFVSAVHRIIVINKLKKSIGKKTSLSSSDQAPLKKKESLSPPESPSNLVRRTQKSKIFYPIQLKTNNSRRVPQRRSIYGSLKGSSVQDNISPVENPLLCDERSLAQSIAVKYPDLILKCYYDSVVRLKRVKSFDKGDYFGENFYKLNQPKENSMFVVSSPQVHLLTITRQSYLDIIKQLDQQSKEKVKIFVNAFPDFKFERVKKFAELFLERTFGKDRVIYNQHHNQDMNLYILRSGEVRLMRESKKDESLSLPARRKQAKYIWNDQNQVSITCVGKGQFFGEEAVMDESSRNYSALSTSSETLVYYLSSNDFEKAQTDFPHFFKVIKENTKGKFAWREEGFLAQRSRFQSPLKNLSLQTPFGSPRSPPQQLNQNEKLAFQRHFSRFSLPKLNNEHFIKGAKSPCRSSRSISGWDPVDPNLRKAHEEAKTLALKSSRKSFKIASIVEKDRLFPTEGEGEKYPSTCRSSLEVSQQFQSRKSLFGSSSISQDEQELRCVNIHTKNFALRKKLALSKKKFDGIVGNSIFQ